MLSKKTVNAFCKSLNKGNVIDIESRSSPSNFSSIHLFCQDLELIRRFGVRVCWILCWYALEILYAAEMFTSTVCSCGEIRPSLMSLSKQASAQCMWQPKSLPISSARACQIPPWKQVQCSDTACMWMRCDSIAWEVRRRTETKDWGKKSARGSENGAGWKKRVTPTYLPEISIKTVTHILGLGVTNSRIAPL